MDIGMLIISFISMIATVCSCIISVKSKNEAKRILGEIKSINVNTGAQAIQDNKVKNKGDIDISNSGNNSGIIGGIITGGICKGDK